MTAADQLVLATRNPAKRAELARILDDAGVGLRLRTTEEYPGLPEVAETGTTFAENAVLKARAVAAATGLPAVADDSGLCVDALNGMPGVLSARWSGPGRGDEANLDLVLAQLHDVAPERRGARFVCAAALARTDGGVEVVEGSISGTLLRERRGDGGFGYDPVFVPTGHTRTTAQMSAADKDAISHRGRALRALLPALARLAGTGG